MFYQCQKIKFSFLFFFFFFSKKKKTHITRETTICRYLYRTIKLSTKLSIKLSFQQFVDFMHIVGCIFIFCGVSVMTSSIEGAL